MTSTSKIVNAHPALSTEQLSQVSERTLRSIIQLHRFNQIPRYKLEMAGVPPLCAVMTELERHRNEAPEVVATVVRGKDCWIISFDCPWCPKHHGRPRQHVHGGGALDDPPDAGHRVSHCHAEGVPDGYFLVIAEAETAMAS